MSNNLLNDLEQDHDSDIEEGFIPSKLIVQQKKQIPLKKKEPQIKKKQFAARYITEGIMRKQPPQCYKRFQFYDTIIQENQTVKIKKQQNPNSFPKPEQLKDLQENIDTQNDNNSDEDSSQLDSTKTIRQMSLNKGKQKQTLMSPYDKYIKSGDYTFVYGRYKDFTFYKDEANFARNDVKLDCLKCQDQVNFKNVKPFELLMNSSSYNQLSPNNRNSSFRQTVLQFDSKFQSANLLCAFKHKQQKYTYSLFMQNDTNTYGYNQWFYFAVRGAQTCIKYKFNIVNFRKKHSFFKYGNKPVVFSLKDSRKQNSSGYSKRAENIKYSKSTIVKSSSSKQKFYQLSFQLQFYNQDDIYFISMGLPFSYSKMIHNLTQMSQIAKKNKISWQMESIGTSIAGNLIPYITIYKSQENKISKKVFQSNQCNLQQSLKDQNNNIKHSQKQKSQQQQKQKHLRSSDNQQKKRIILVIARQHPGQTWSSYLMDEFLHNLVTQSTKQSEYLLENFVIKCIPMINVDGVIYGNFRCDLAGMDLNRNWRSPSTILHPQICSIKLQIQRLTNEGHKIQCCFDLHGHSKQYNVFCYSCNTDEHECRLLPYIFNQINPEFHFPFCTFGLSKYKLSTARAVIFSIIKNTNVLTIQSSFFASKILGKLKIFQPNTFKNMATTLIKGLKSYFSHDSLRQVSKEIIRLRMSQFLQSANKSKELSGSESQPEVDEIDITEKLQKIIPKNLVNQCKQQMQKSPKKKYGTRKQSKKLNQNQSKDKYKIRTSYLSQNKSRTIDLQKDMTLQAIQQQSSHIQKGQQRKKNMNKTVVSTFTKKEVASKSFFQSQNSQIIKQNQKILIRDLIQKQETKLPYFAKQKPQLVPMKLKNQSFQIFRDAYNATQKKIKNDSTLQAFRNRSRNPSKKLMINRNQQQKQQEFPLLCILSDGKKKTHAEKFKQKKEKPIPIKPDLGQKIDKTAIQTRTEAIRQLRQKNKNSMQLVSKIWRQNFTRYGMAFSTFKIAK